MAHSNHYFRMKNKLSPDRHIDILARGLEYGEEGEVFENMIQVIVKGPIYGTSDVGEVGIYLTEQEQDDLIAGIMERRGGIITINGKADSGTLLMIARKMKPEISSDGQEQSKIYPANK